MKSVLNMAIATFLAILLDKSDCIESNFGFFASPGLVLAPQTSFHSGSGINSFVPGIIPAQNAPEQNLAHPAVVENSIAESQLPSELLNPFYKNPAIAAGLAKESWFSNKEFPVHHREAEKIPRSQIFKLISRLQHRRR